MGSPAPAGVRGPIRERETPADDYPDVGTDFEPELGNPEGVIDGGDAKPVDRPAPVDFAVDRFETNR